MKSVREVAIPTLALTVITLVVSALLVITYNFTKVEQVGDLSAKDIKAAKVLFENSENFETLEVEGLDEKIINVIIPDNDSGVAIEIETKGYSKGLVMMVALDDTGVITGMTVVTSSETPGLGTAIGEEDFTKQFVGKSTAPLTAVKGEAKSDTEIVAVSGATISSKAAIECANLALDAYPSVKEAAGNE